MNVIVQVPGKTSHVAGWEIFQPALSYEIYQLATYKNRFQTF